MYNPKQAETNATRVTFINDNTAPQRIITAPRCAVTLDSLFAQIQLRTGNRRVITNAVAERARILEQHDEPEIYRNLIQPLQQARVAFEKAGKQSKLYLGPHQLHVLQGRIQRHRITTREPVFADLEAEENSLLRTIERYAQKRSIKEVDLRASYTATEEAKRNASSLVGRCDMNREQHEGVTLAWTLARDRGPVLFINKNKSFAYLTHILAKKTPYEGTITVMQTVTGNSSD